MVLIPLNYTFSQGKLDVQVHLYTQLSLKQFKLNNSDYTSSVVFCSVTIGSPDRPITKDGKWAEKKNRSWNSKRTLNKWKEQWARSVNRKLEEDGFEERIDHRSYKERGKYQKAQVHEGKLISGLRKKLQQNKDSQVSDYITDNPDAAAYYEAIIQQNDLNREHNLIVEQLEKDGTADAKLALEDLEAAYQEISKGIKAEREAKTTKAEKTDSEVESALSVDDMVAEAIANTMADTDASTEAANSSSGGSGDGQDDSNSRGTGADRNNRAERSSDARDDSVRDSPGQKSEWDSFNNWDDPDIEPDPPDSAQDRIQQPSTTNAAHSKRVAEQTTEIEALQKAFQTQNRYRDTNNRRVRSAVDEYRLQLANATAKIKPEEVAKEFRDATPSALEFERQIREYLRRRGFNDLQIRKAMRTASPALYKKSQQHARMYAKKFNNYLLKTQRDFVRKEEQKKQEQNRRRGRSR